MEAKSRIKEKYLKQLHAKRPRYGTERHYPEDMSRARRVASRVFSLLDPVVEHQGLVTSQTRHGSYRGEKVVRKSGIVEIRRAVSVIRSPEGVRFARSNLEVPGVSGFVKVGDEGEEGGRIWVPATDDDGETESLVHPIRQSGEELPPEKEATSRE